MTWIRYISLSLIAVLATFVTAFAGEKINIDKNGLAVQGYDVVAFFTKKLATKGNPEITAQHLGGTYRFDSEANKKRFLANPEKYAPAYGGYCAYAVSKGYVAPIQIEAWEIIDGRLVLQFNSSVKKDFERNLEANMALADKNWKKLSQ